MCDAFVFLTKYDLTAQPTLDVMSHYALDVLVLLTERASCSRSAIGSTIIRCQKYYFVPGVNFYAKNITG